MDPRLIVNYLLLLVRRNFLNESAYGQPVDMPR